MTPTEAIAAGVAEIPYLQNTLEVLKQFSDGGTGTALDIDRHQRIIAALTAMEGVAKGTHVIIELELLKARLPESFRAMITKT